MHVRKNRELAWVGVTRRAWAKWLRLGFGFDGGSFKLATESTFWISIELGEGRLHYSWTEIENGADALKPLNELKQFILHQRIVIHGYGDK
jgi:hypothetical protein